jgi:hypothetical protein
MSPFFLKKTVIGPLELLPWTMTTQDAISKLNLGELSENKQIAACAWLQSRDPEDVEQAISDGTALEQIKAFGRWFPLALSKPVSEWCAIQSKCIEEGRIDILEKPGSKGDAPKN